MSWFKNWFKPETQEEAADRKRRRGSDTEAGSYGLDAIFDVGSSFDGGDCGGGDAGGGDCGGGDGGGCGE